MPSRARQSTAAPTPTQARGTTQLPIYEAPAFPLNDGAQRALANLKQTHSLRKLDSSLEDAQNALSVAAAEINDRLTEKEKATRKRKAQAQAGEPGTEDAGNAEDLEQSLNELRDKVERMTSRMDESMRKMIDAQYGVQSIDKSVAGVAQDLGARASTQASTQNAQSQRRRRRETGIEDDEDDADDEEYQDFTPTDPSGGTQAQQTPIEAFRAKVEDEKTRYQSFSHTARYANNNKYRDFRRVIHDAKHPDGEVPLPHHNEWFNEGDEPVPGVTTRANANAGNGEDSDDDLAVSRATISTKCPLTLQEFKTPLTSKKCPHSFESEAILEMIGRSQNKEGGGRNGVRYVQCPVPGCSQNLTKNDLHTDAVLVRQIKRIQRAKELDAEDDEGNGGERGEQPTVIEDGDDDAADVDDIVNDAGVPQTQMKAEPKSLTNIKRSASTAPRGRPNVVDLGSGSDSDEADEDDTMEE